MRLLIIAALAIGSASAFAQSMDSGELYCVKGKDEPETHIFKISERDDSEAFVRQYQPQEKCPDAQVTR